MPPFNNAHWFKKNNQNRFSIGIVVFQKFQRFFKISMRLDFQSRLPPKMLTWVFSYFCWNMRSGVNNFCPCSGILKDQKCQSAVSLDMLCYSNSYLLALPASFSVKVSFNSFSLEANFLFSMSENLSSTSKFKSWSTKIVKVEILLRYLDIPPCPSRKLHFWNFYQVLNWRWYFVKCLSHGLLSASVPYIGILISWTCKKVQLLFLFCRFSDSYIFEAIGLNFSAEVSIEMFFYEYWVICKYDSLCYRSIFLCALTENIAVRPRLL